MERRKVSSGSPYEPVIGFSRAGRGQPCRGVRDGADHARRRGAAGGRVQPGEAVPRDHRGGAGGGGRFGVRRRAHAHVPDDVEDWEEVGRAHGEFFADVRPTSTMVVVTGFLDPRWRVEMEADAIVDAWVGSR